jgi:hypothetical protein
VADDVALELGEFLDYVWGNAASWGDQEVWVYVPYQLPPYAPEDWTKAMFTWPRQRAGVIKHILRRTAERANVFYSPALYARARPTKPNVIGSWVLWVDFDGNAPDDWAPLDVPEPTMRVRSSLEGREHVYWKLDTFLSDIDVLEDRNRAIAYILKADTSGWDADQVLRPIHTINQKNGLPVTLLVKE